MLVKLADYYSSERQTKKTTTRELSAESIRTASSDVQFIIAELARERDKFSEYWTEEVRKRREVEDELDKTRHHVFEIRATARELMLSLRLNSRQQEMLESIAEDKNEREEQHEDKAITR